MGGFQIKLLDIKDRKGRFIDEEGKTNHERCKVEPEPA
eukprot:CAMPEP_0185745698 /NCGR_PEP_ID=MMETSP1174-20130828/4095_1 /TAXON_ID=35687 /ORGANISM="Dictyocha speculum, Strain CCMP1381" /LENGTH=37 /DNA_ID= /DNA_START= /DNA_END= /DNA_ORIENTATION=